MIRCDDASKGTVDAQPTMADDGPPIGKKKRMLRCETMLHCMLMALMPSSTHALQNALL